MAPQRWELRTENQGRSQSHLEGWLLHPEAWEGVELKVCSHP